MTLLMAPEAVRLLDGIEIEIVFFSLMIINHARGSELSSCTVGQPFNEWASHVAGNAVFDGSMVNVRFTISAG